MANNAELQKIEVDEKIIGVLNFNLMIPVTDKQLMPVDIKEHKGDTSKIKAWKKLCAKELKWCCQNEKIIRDKAKNLYTNVLKISNMFVKMALNIGAPGNLDRH